MKSGQKIAQASVSYSIGAGVGDGEMEARIRAFEWSNTPLGPIHQWPQSLRTVVNILLSSHYAMWMAWGRELTVFYNDAYRPTLGIKHPWALGARTPRGDLRDVASALASIKTEDEVFNALNDQLTMRSKAVSLICSVAKSAPR